MTFIWIIIFILTPAGISAGTTVTGHTGRSVQIKCPYDSGYETYIKYLCRGKCSDLWGTKDIPVQSGSAEDQRFSLDDDTAARVFTITITDLRPEDEGTYWMKQRTAGTDHSEAKQDDVIYTTVTHSGCRPAQAADSADSGAADVLYATVRVQNDEVTSTDQQGEPQYASVTLHHHTAATGPPTQKAEEPSLIYSTVIKD
ncbi:hypothetical protein MHYP_G00101660 [Metynnis hypsauchen]